jgi:hypothetical protein
VGDASVQPSQDGDPAGTAEAFSYTAAQTGSSRTVSFYIDPSNRATGAQIGLYADSGWNSPGSRLAQASFTPTPGWNTITLPGASVTAGKKYWLAVLGTGGALAFRDQGSGSKDEEYRSQGLTQLPTKWRDGAAWNSGTASFYVSG